MEVHTCMRVRAAGTFWFGMGLCMFYLLMLTPSEGLTLRCVGRTRVGLKGSRCLSTTNDRQQILFTVVLLPLYHVHGTYIYLYIYFRLAHSQRLFKTARHGSRRGG